MERRSVFFKNGNFYIVESDKYETVEQLNTRGWFIADRAPQSREQFDESVRLSRINRNVTIYNRFV